MTMGLSTPRPLRVVVADDSTLAREAISYLLASISHVELVASCDDVESLIAAVTTERPDLVVIDVALSRSVGGEGSSIAARLLDPSCAVGVVEIGHGAGSGEVRYGAARHVYLSKAQLIDGDDLAAAVHHVTRGRPSTR
jgi:DNA-binding NarL/FixJ family response regulator